MPRRARKTPDSKKVIGYIRVSTEEQNLGPEAQEKVLEDWCKANGSVLCEVFYDSGVSEGAELDKRPALLKAIDALKEHNAGILLVAKRDRLARETMFAAMIERLVERSGARVRSADGVGNGDGPEDQLLRTIIDAFATYERQIIKGRTKAALAVKKTRRERVGQIPYGWKLSQDGVHVEPEPEEQEVIRIAGGLRAKGLTFQAIGKALAEQGMFPRGGKRKWHPQTISNILRADAA